MRYFFILLVCFIAGNSFGLGKRVTVENCGASIYSQPRIVGGQPVWQGEFPWMVTLHQLSDYDFDHVCGASIVNERWILTAAHCIEKSNQPEVYEIYVGLHHLSRKWAKQTERHKIIKILNHETFSKHTFQDDIALMKTEDAIDFHGSNGFVNAICLPAMHERTPNTMATVTGWGDTQEGGDPSDVLLTVTVPIIARNVCNASYNSDETKMKYEITENMICAGSAGFDSCQADSGGPLVMYKYGRGILYGIVSFGYGCGKHGYPGVYTRVSSYIGWINNKVLSDQS